MVANFDNSELSDFSLPEPDDLLPGWITMRMMSDDWCFGLLTTNGIVIAIRSIHNIYQAADGSIWIDVELMDAPVASIADFKTLTAPTSRTTASLNTSHIVAAFELADT